MPCKRTSSIERTLTGKKASQLKEQDYVYVLQPKADHQGSKILIKSNQLVRKVGTDKTQVHHIMGLARSFKQPMPDVKTTSQEGKPDPEVIIKHDNLYARAWECD